MAERAPRKQAGPEKQAAATASTEANRPTAQGAKEEATAPGRRRTFTLEELHATWLGLSEDIRAHVMQSPMHPSLREALSRLFKALDNWVQDSKWFEGKAPLVRNLSGAFLVVAKDYVTDLFAGYEELDAADSMGASIEVDKLTDAVSGGYLAELLLPGRDVERTAAPASLRGGNILYTVKSGPSAGEVRPAVVIEEGVEEETAAIFVFWKASDVPHEPPMELEAVPYNEDGEPGSWCFNEDIGKSVPKRQDGVGDASELS